MTTVSVVVPVYDTEKYLCECIRSVQGQTFRNWELIIVDDGSEDGSLDLAERFAAEDERITVISCGHHRQGTARNEGIRRASGKYVMMLDSDDVLKENAVEVLFGVCEKNDLDVLTFDSIGFEDENEPPDTIPDDLADRSGLSLEGRIFDGKSFWKEANDRRGVLYGPMHYFTKRSFLTDNDLFFEKEIIFEDNDWTLRLFFAAQRMMYIPEKLYLKRYRKGSVLTGAKTCEILSSSFVIFDLLLDIFKNAGSPDERDMTLSVIEVCLDRVRSAMEKARGMQVSEAEEAAASYCASLEKRLEEAASGSLPAGNDIELTATCFDACICMIDALKEDASGAIRKWYRLSEPGVTAAIYGTGRVSDIFLDWYEKRAGKIGEGCFFMMTETDRSAHRGRAVCSPDGYAGKPDVIVIAASENARRTISGKIDEVYGKEQRRIAVHVLLTEGRLSYGH